MRQRAANLDQQAEYFNFMRSRGRLGLLYRKNYLYPRLARSLSGRVLDVGAGIGDFLAFRPETKGVDINPYAVEWCRQHGLDCQLMEVDCLPFDDDCFEGVVLDNVLEHLVEPRPLLAEIRRVLTPSGWLLIGVPGLRGYKSDPDHKVFYDEDNLKCVIEVNGFTEVRMIHMPLKSKWLASWLSQYCLYGVFERT